MHLPGDVHILPTRDAVFEQLGQTFEQRAREAIDQRGVFHLALSGGSTPEPFYALLVTDTRWRLFPWDKTHLWLVDERRVPESDDKSNFKMIRESLADHVVMRKRQIHPMPVMEDDPATLYEAALAEAFELPPPPEPPEGGGAGVPKMDVLLLGMGDDAHTASIFPHSDAVGVRDRWVFVNAGEHVTPPDRVTLTYPVLNAARHVAVLLSGAKKAATLQRVSQQLQQHGPDPAAMPITGVDPRPQGGTIGWYLDEAAAGKD